MQTLRLRQLTIWVRLAIYGHVPVDPFTYCCDER